MIKWKLQFGINSRFFLYNGPHFYSLHFTLSTLCVKICKWNCISHSSHNFIGTCLKSSICLLTPDKFNFNYFYLPLATALDTNRLPVRIPLSGTRLSFTTVSSLWFLYYSNRSFRIHTQTSLIYVRIYI